MIILDDTGNKAGNKQTQQERNMTADDWDKLVGWVCVVVWVFVIYLVKVEGL